MRRFFLILTPALLLGLAACGGGNTNQSAAPTAEPRIIAEANGRVGTQQAVTVQPSSPPVSQPDNPADGLGIIDVAATVGGDGTVAVTGKVVNNGSAPAKTTSIAVEIVDATGKRVTRQQFAYPQLPTIRPGDEVAWTGQTQFKLADGQKVQVAIAGEPVQ